MSDKTPEDVSYVGELSSYNINHGEAFDVRSLDTETLELNGIRVLFTDGKYGVHGADFVSDVD